jgi:hypothetical protein
MWFMWLIELQLEGKVWGPRCIPRGDEQMESLDFSTFGRACLFSLHPNYVITLLAPLSASILGAYLGGGLTNAGGFGGHWTIKDYGVCTPYTAGATQQSEYMDR